MSVKNSIFIIVTVSCQIKNSGVLLRERSVPRRKADGKNLFPLKNKIIPMYVETVVLGGELAVPCTRNPLYAGLNSPSRILSKMPAVLIGRRATDTHEPCQVRKEAAISDGVCVADRSRSAFSGLKGKDSNRGCTTASYSPALNTPDGFVYNPTTDSSEDTERDFNASTFEIRSRDGYEGFTGSGEHRLIKRERVA